MKYALAINIILLFTISINAQIGGIRVYAGTASMVNKNEIANPDGTSHSGFHIGADGRLMSGGMAFLVGVRYTSVSLIPGKNFKLSGHNSTMAMMNGRVGLDISIYSFSSMARIRTKALASLDIILSQSGSDLPPAGFILNDGWSGFVTGLGVDIGPAIVDIEYELGILNAYNMKKGSTFNSLTFSVGFFF